MGILAELDIAGPVPLFFNAPALPDQPQQCFWRCSQAGDEQVLPELPFASARGRVGVHLHDPGAAWPVLFDVIGSFFRPQRPDRVTAVPFLVILCHKRDVTLSLKLEDHLTAQGALVVLNRPAHVGPLGEAPPKNDCVV